MPESELERSLKREREALQQLRDELKLQLHLGKAEAKKEWDRLERQWVQLEAELGRVGEQAKEPLEDIGRAARSLVDELKSGYSRIKHQLKS